MMHIVHILANLLSVKLANTSAELGNVKKIIMTTFATSKFSKNEYVY